MTSVGMTTCGRRAVYFLMGRPATTQLAVRLSPTPCYRCEKPRSAASISCPMGELRAPKNVDWGGRHVDAATSRSRALERRVPRCFSLARSMDVQTSSVVDDRAPARLTPRDDDRVIETSIPGR